MLTAAAAALSTASIGRQQRSSLCRYRPSTFGSRSPAVPVHVTTELLVIDHPRRIVNNNELTAAPCTSQLLQQDQLQLLTPIIN